MKKADVKVGGLYRAKVSGKLTTVRVDAIRERDGWNGGSIYASQRKATTVYDVTNLATGRRTTFRSAAKFRGPAVGVGKQETDHAERQVNEQLEADYREFDAAQRLEGRP